MNKLLLTLGLLLTLNLYAAPAPFGLELGKATIDDLKNKYSVKKTGINAVSFGDMYEINTSTIDFDGLQSISAAFNMKGKLIAISAKLKKSRFDDLFSSLNRKYKLISKEIPSVGNKYANFEDGLTVIILKADHLSFSMDMTYIQSEFLNEIIKEREKQKMDNKAKDESQL